MGKREARYWERNSEKEVETWCSIETHTQSLYVHVDQCHSNKFKLKKELNSEKIREKKEVERY